MSKIIPIFAAEVMQGKVVVKSKMKFRDYLSTLRGRVELIIRPYRARRTLNQNGYYWGAHIALLADHFGYTAQEMHDALKLKFLRKEGMLPTLRSTALMDSNEFYEYMQEVEKFAAENNIRIPTPEEYHENNLYGEGIPN